MLVYDDVVLERGGAVRGRVVGPPTAAAAAAAADGAAGIAAAALGSIEGKAGM